MANVALLREADRGVIRIAGALIVLKMAADAGGVGEVVVAVGGGMTLAALHVGVRSGERPAGGGVIEGSRGPVGSAVADFALLRESAGDVIRAGGSLIVLEMATHAGGVGEVVVAVGGGMTLAALHVDVRSGERPAGGGVIESSRGPVGGTVAHFALLREAAGDVIRVVGALIILEMATDAGGGGQVVIAVDVTLSALHAYVRPSQRECSLRVIEFGRLPGGRRMAHLALLWHAGRNVIRIRSALVVLQMAGHACGAGEIEISVGMALIALQLGVPAGQRETHGIMIEICRLPSAGGMALLASLGKAQSEVVGIAGLLEIQKVATHARRRSALILSSSMTGRAVQGRMHSG